MSSFEIIPLICLIVSDLSHTLSSRSKTLAPRQRSQVPQGTHGRSGADGRVVHVRLGSWFRDNALMQFATVHDPVNVVRHGRSEQFFLLDDQDRL
jgi:hypothetical protein